MVVLGLDIGGANLKAATTDGRAISVPFPLWKQPDALPAALAELIANFPDATELAVTMTGELCDCYATKREGVNRILDAVASPTRVWSTSGEFLSIDLARHQTLSVAASNWHALATFAGRFAPVGSALLIDIGSTTTDVIPLRDGSPVARGRTDFDRLQTGELVYVGVKRTAIMALGLPKVCAEYFADTRDALIALGDCPEEPHADDTADNRFATRNECLARLARMLGGDLDTLSEERIVEFAGESKLAMIDRIAIAIQSAQPADIILLSGAGEWLTRPIVERLRPETRIISLTEKLGPELSACAPAYAVAVLASEMRR